MNPDRRIKREAGRSLLSTTNETPDNDRKPKPRDIVRAVRNGQKNPFLQGSAPNIAFAFAEELERRSRDASNPQLARTAREALDAHDPPEIEERRPAPPRPHAHDRRRNERLGSSLMMASSEPEEDKSAGRDAPTPPSLQPDQPRFWEVRGWPDVHLPSQIPVVNLANDRIRILLEDEPAVFEIVENPDATNVSPPNYVHEYGFRAIAEHSDEIERQARLAGVDPNLVRAIVYVENSQGHYFGAASILDSLHLSKSVLPMNIRPKFWLPLIDGEIDVYDPHDNIRLGVELIRRIQDRIVDPTPEKVGSIYNISGRELTSDFGARVQRAYDERSWDIPLPDPLPEDSSP